MVFPPADEDVYKRQKQGEAQGFFDRWGTGWYRRTLRLEKKPETVYRLRFDGVYENSQVTINGTYVGGRKYGYSTFALDVTEALADGELSLIHICLFCCSGCGQDGFLFFRERNC